MERDFTERNNLIQRIDFAGMKKYKANKIQLVLLILFLLWWLNYSFPILRFSNVIVNYYIGTLFCIFPTLLLLNTFLLAIKPLIKVLSWCIFGLMTLPFLLFLLFNLLEISDIQNTGKDDFFENIHKIKSSNYNIIIYRTNGGATTDFGIVVRQEKEIFSGLLLVKNLYSQYHCYDIKYKLVNKNFLLINNYQNETSTTIKLNDWVFF